MRNPYYHQQNPYYGSMGGGQFEFDPIIAPFTPLPTETFGNTTNVLNKNYDTALDDLSKSEQMLASLQAAGYDGDQKELQRIKSEFLNEFQNIHSKGDYENQFSSTKKLASKLGSQVIPISQRKQQYDADITTAYTNRDILDKDKYVKGYTALEKKLPSLQNINGQLINTYDPSRKAFLDIKDVNLYERMKGLLAGHDNSVSNFNTIKELKDSQGNPLLQTLRNTSIEQWKKEDIDKLANEIASGDAEIQAYKNKLDQLQQLGEEVGDEDLAGVSFKDELVAAISGVSDFYNVRKVRSNDQVIQNYTKDSGNSTPTSNGLLLTSDSAGNQITHQDQYKNLSEQIKTLRQSGDESGAKNLEELQKYYSDQMLNSLSENERIIYNYYNNLEDEIDAVLSQYDDKVQTAYRTQKEEEFANKTKELTGNPISASIIKSILNKGNKTLKENLSKVPNISRENTTYYGTNRNKDTFTNIGQINDLLNEEAKGSMDISLVEGFTTNDGKSWQDYFNKQKDSKKYKDYKNIKWELNAQDGFDTKGLPMTTVAVYGEDDNGNIERLELHNVNIGGDESWNNANRVANGLIKDGQSQLNRGEETGYKVYESGVVLKNGVKLLPSGKRVSQEVIRINPLMMEDKVPKYIDVGNDKLKVVKQNGIVTIETKDGVVTNKEGQPFNFYNQKDIIKYVGENYGTQY